MGGGFGAVTSPAPFYAEAQPAVLGQPPKSNNCITSGVHSGIQGQIALILAQQSPDLQCEDPNPG